MSIVYCWRTSVFVYFLLTCIRLVTSSDLLSSACIYLNIDCCRKPLVELNLYSFTYDLAKFHSQPFASTLVVHSLKSHFYHQSGPLFFYFHGDTGTGKTFLTNLIIKNIYLHGINSKFVKFFHLGKDYFKHEEEKRIIDISYKIFIKVASCQESLFVFDGYSDNWSKIVKNILGDKTFMKAIFIFISTSDFQEINAYMYKKQNHKSAMHYEDLDEARARIPLLKSGNFVYVPFLPMDREDVHQCISNRLKELNFHLHPIVKELTSKIISQIEFSNDISISGCKRVADKVSLFLSNKQEL